MATKKPIIWKFENLVNLSLTIVNVYEYLMSKKIIKIENSKTWENRKFGFVSAQDQKCNRLKYMQLSHCNDSSCSYLAPQGARSGMRYAESCKKFDKNWNNDNHIKLTLLCGRIDRGDTSGWPNNETMTARGCEFVTLFRMILCTITRVAIVIFTP